MIFAETEVIGMLYCPKCQALSMDGVACPACGSKKLREAQPEDPVLLMTAGGEDCGRAVQALQAEEIPCELRMSGAGGPPEELYGRAPGTEKNIFVPYGSLDRCKEVLGSAGMLDESGRLKRNGEAEMSTPRRSFWRVFSALLFALLVWAAVSLSDHIAEAIKVWLSTRT